MAATRQEVWQGDPFLLGSSFCDFGACVLSFAEGKVKQDGREGGDAFPLSSMSLPVPRFIAKLKFKLWDIDKTRISGAIKRLSN